MTGKIKALMIIRLLLVTLGMVAGSLVLQVEKIPFYSIIAFFYFATLVYGLLIKLDFPVYINVYLQIIIDIVMETAIIHYAGGADSIYALLYVPSIVSAGVIISGRAAKTIAGLSSVFYALVSISEYFNIIRPIDEAVRVYAEGIGSLLFIVSFRIILFCLIGYLASYLSRELYKERRELSRLRNLADIILKKISSGVITLDSSEKIIYANPSACRILGREKDDLIGTKWQDVFLREYGAEKAEQFIEEAKTSNGTEVDITRSAGEKLILNCSYTELTDDKNNNIGGVFAFIDLTPIKEQLRVKHAFDNIVGRSSHMQEIYEIIERVAQAESTVLVYGESGTGKELVAKAVHYHSARKNKPFVAINCGGLPEGLLESELFGHVKGSFTGAVNDKAGLFQVADGGSIFLDEISATSPAIQVKLLRVLQEREIKKVGDTKDIPVDVRIIAATNKKLDEEVKKGLFREDLYYRLSVIPVFLPPLRKRIEDIPLLVEHFLSKYSGPDENKRKTLAPGVMDMLLCYNWPGNVRELENVIERAVTLSEGSMILQRDLPEEILKIQGKGKERFMALLKNFIKQKEKEYINTVILETNGDKKAAADILGIDLATLYRKLHE